MDPIRLKILGSGSALPNKNRFHSSQLLEVAGRQYLIDCGEGTQIRLWQCVGRTSRLHQVFISHLHGDHCLGLLGLISSFAMLGRSNNLEIYSPPGLEELLRPQIDFFCKDRNFEVVFYPFSPYRPEVIYEDKTLTVSTLPLKHRVPTCGFIFKEKEKELHLNRAMLDAFSVPISAMKSIKLGADFVDERGVVVPNAKLTLPADKSRMYVYCSDTIYSEKIIPLIENADCLYHEATFMDKDAQRAKDTFHTTASQAATIALKANVGKLILGHFSSRYKTIDGLLDEAKTIFENTSLATDGGEFTF
ncbi:MAG: ribonuclease Z [Paludibacteraceae bacterium]|nr:ribonuclease Z [Paludibacteraceae bacterium]